jgi:hypothetical protein
MAPHNGSISIHEIAALLYERLGPHVTAYLADADPQQIAAYAHGADVPLVHARRLRAGFKIVREIEAAYDTATAKAWLFGTNTDLDEQAPIEVIRAATSAEQCAEVWRAARAFAHGD